MAEYLTIEVPSVPNGPVGVDSRRADADYFRQAARNIRHAARRGKSFAGSNVTETVARLCEATAEALEEDIQSDPCDEETHSWDHFPSAHFDSYWIRCSRTGPHDEHEDSNTGLTWSTRPANGSQE